jgi:hypothetical protein
LTNQTKLRGRIQTLLLVAGPGGAWCRGTAMVAQENTVFYCFAQSVMQHAVRVCVLQQSKTYSTAL